MAEPIYLYRVPVKSWRKVEIEKIRVTRYTEKSYWTKVGNAPEERHGRHTDWQETFTSYHEAKLGRIAQADKHIQGIEKEIASLQKELEDQRQYKFLYENDSILESDLTITDY